MDFDFVSSYVDLVFLFKKGLSETLTFMIEDFPNLKDFANLILCKTQDLQSLSDLENLTTHTFYRRATIFERCPFE